MRLRWYRILSYVWLIVATVGIIKGWTFTVGIALIVSVMYGCTDSLIEEIRRQSRIRVRRYGR